MPLFVELGVVLFLILANGFFAMSELAIVSARRLRLKRLAEDGHKGAALALRLAEDPGSFLSLVQIGVTINSILAGAFSGATLALRLAVPLADVPLIAPYAEPVAFAITVSGVTYLTLMVGELIPKRIGLSYAEPIAIRISHAMIFCARIAAPLVWVFKRSTDFFLTLFGLGRAQSSPITEDEVRGMIAEGTETGVFKKAERHMLESVMRLADRTVRTIMTPRIDMVWLDADDTPHQHKAVIRASGYSRFPVARGDLEQILGVVHAKDMLNASFDGHILTVKNVMRPALIVPDTSPVLRVLDQFRQSGQHIAIVVDEYGSVEGLVSVTDILVGITGELPERGQEEEGKPIRREDGSWLIDGMTPIDEVERLLDLKNMVGDGDFHTLAGFVIDRLGRIPAAGDHFTWEGARFEVVDMDGRRVDKVLVYPPAEESPPAQ